MVRRRIGQELENRQRCHRFAGTGFPDQRHSLTPAYVKRYTVDGQRLTAVGAEDDGKIADGKEGVGTQANVFRGSKASRTASPMKIRSESIAATVKKPVNPSQGACTFALPCDNNSPSEGEPGGRPKPRKSSAV